MRCELIWRQISPNRYYFPYNVNIWDAVVWTIPIFRQFSDSSSFASEVIPGAMPGEVLIFFSFLSSKGNQQLILFNSIFIVGLMRTRFHATSDCIWDSRLSGSFNPDFFFVLFFFGDGWKVAEALKQGIFPLLVKIPSQTNSHCISILYSKRDVFFSCLKETSDYLVLPRKHILNIYVKL